MAIDWPRVAQRIRGLVVPSDPADLPGTAERLGVSERDLNDAVRERSRLSTLMVAAAIVRVYGLDPTWVLTGQYDGVTHRAALAAGRAEIDAMLRRIVSEAGSGRMSDEVRPV